MTHRRDKKLFRPATVKIWTIVIYESQGRFRQDTARDMAKGFIDGAISVGKCIHYIAFFLLQENWLIPHRYVDHGYSTLDLLGEWPGKYRRGMFFFLHDIRDVDMTLLSFLSNWRKLARPASTRREVPRAWSLLSSPRAAMTSIRLLRSERYIRLRFVFLFTDVLSYHLVSGTYRWVQYLFFLSLFLNGAQMGVATQCLKSSKCNRAKIQYWANVMLKCAFFSNDIDFACTYETQGQCKTRRHQCCPRRLLYSWPSQPYHRHG